MFSFLCYFNCLHCNFREEAPERGNRGRGRGVANSNFKPVYRAEEYTREKTSREKRIDQLAPRLRDKAREKMVREEREKGKDVKESVDYDPEVFKGKIIFLPSIYPYICLSDSVSHCGSLLMYVANVVQSEPL